MTWYIFLVHYADKADKPMNIENKINIDPWKNNRIQCTPVTQLSRVRGQRGPALIKWASLISVYIPAIATLSHYQYYHIPRTRLWFSDHRSQTIRLAIESQRLRKRWITNRRNKISAVALTLMNIKKLIHWSICWGVKKRMMNMMSGYRAGPIISHQPGRNYRAEKTRQ